MSRPNASYETSLKLAGAANELDNAVEHGDRGTAQAVLEKHGDRRLGGWPGLGSSYGELSDDAYGSYNRAAAAAKDKFGL